VDSDNINPTEICLIIRIPFLIKGDMPQWTLPPTRPKEQ